VEFSTRPISENVDFLRTWRPQEDKQLQTVTALAQELRTAVGNDPKTYASSADQFVCLKPIYIRRFLEGLQSTANNQRDFDWGKVLKLIEFTYSQYGQAIDHATLAEGDDDDWAWACHSASEFLAAEAPRSVMNSRRCMCPSGTGFVQLSKDYHLAIGGESEMAPSPNEA
jgi:hypothetical protein